ncbi:MAG: peptide-methionine (S)-S-oxide reductase MsrA [Candidatus Tectomicrobia bacterium]|nr:peptide-methionine (S)-S-oxide reductase MsrA [Candidatus Tectomicrobia bacterium]
MMTTNRAYGWTMAALLCGVLLSAMTVHPAAAQDGQAKATFAGGCFWCVEEAFEKVPGVISAVSGYIDGHVDSPTYRQVTSGRTGHTEAVEVIFDPAEVTYEQLLDVFWRNVDPTVVDRQFCDVGSQYRTGIFVHDDEQQMLAEASRLALEESKPFPEPIVTPIVAASTFYPAEDYHQDYYKINPLRYKFYKWNCGRAQRLEELWG